MQKNELHETYRCANSHFRADAPTPQSCVDVVGIAPHHFELASSPDVVEGLQASPTPLSLIAPGALLIAVALAAALTMMTKLWDFPLGGGGGGKHMQ